MVELLSRKNSKVRAGKRHKAKAGAKRVRTFKVYRYDPEVGENPRWDIYDVDLDSCGPMVLDALNAIKNDIDSDAHLPALLPRGDLRFVCDEHIGAQHARLHQGHRRPAAGAITISPLPHQPVIKDLVPDLSNFIAQYSAIQPYLQTQTPEPDAEWRQSPEERAKLDGLYECILCACCSTSCPSYWWNSERFYGPAALLQAYRWIADSRDENQGERLDALEDPFKLYRCHTIMNCAQVCPKGLNPAKAIAEIKKAMVDRKL